MPTSKEIRQKIKQELGFNSRQVSVKNRPGGYSWSFTVTIRTPEANYYQVEQVANTFESIDRCEYSGEILAGGNTYISMAVSDEVTNVWESKWLPVVKPLNLLDDSFEYGEIETDSGRYIVKKDGNTYTVFFSEAGSDIGHHVFNISYYTPNKWNDKSTENGVASKIELHNQEMEFKRMKGTKKTDSLPEENVLPVFDSEGRKAIYIEDSLDIEFFKANEEVNNHDENRIFASKFISCPVYKGLVIQLECAIESGSYNDIQFIRNIIDKNYFVRTIDSNESEEFETKTLDGVSGNPVKIIFNTEIEKIQVKFDTKPELDVLRSLKSFYFGWSRKTNSWHGSIGKGKDSLTLFLRKHGYLALTETL